MVEDIIWALHMDRLLLDIEPDFSELGVRQFHLDQ